MKPNSQILVNIENTNPPRSVQAWNGVLGGILINGPATANYDVDLGSMFLNDWSHQTADVEYLEAELRGPPTLDNGLINGTNVYNDLGERWTTTFVAGTTYRIRLVNGAVSYLLESVLVTVFRGQYLLSR